MYDSIVQLDYKFAVASKGFLAFLPDCCSTLHFILKLLNMKKDEEQM